MDFQQLLGKEDKLRIIQETVPGRQITLAHIIAGPDALFIRSWVWIPAWITPRSAIGILTITPAKPPLSPPIFPSRPRGWSWALWTLQRHGNRHRQRVRCGGVSPGRAGLCPRYPGLHRLPRHQDLRSNAVKKIILMGRVGCGKTTLTQALRGKTIHYHKTQYINHHDVVIDTPGEYAETQSLGRALPSIPMRRTWWACW